MGGSLITNKKEIFPSIYIAPIIDNTEMFRVPERGNALTVGYSAFGNPYRAVILTENTVLKERSIVPALGGNTKYEVAYHVNDFINISNNAVFLARLLGSASTVKSIKSVDGDTLVEDADVNIFGANNMNEWGDTTPTAPLEILPKFCPQETVTVDVDYTHEDRMMEVKVYDELGRKLYAVAGSIDPQAEDDYNENIFIGNRTNHDYLQIKSIPTDAIYNATFSATHTFTNGLVVDAGAIDVQHIAGVVENNIEYVDYIFTAGLRDIDTIKMLILAAKKESISTIADAFGNTITDVIQWRSHFDDIADSNVYFIWNNGANFKFNAGVQAIGVSGWYAGQKVKSNLSLVKGWSEFRLNGVAGVNYPVGRVHVGSVNSLTDYDKTTLTEARINYLYAKNRDVVVSDVLSSSKKNTHLMSFDVADAVRFIDRMIARMLAQSMYKNLYFAQSTVDQHVNKFLHIDCRANHFFDADVDNEKQIRYQITSENNDTVVVSWQGYMEGVMRKGEVRPQIERIKDR